MADQIEAAKKLQGRIRMYLEDSGALITAREDLALEQELLIESGNFLAHAATQAQRIGELEEASRLLQQAVHERVEERDGLRKALERIERWELPSSGRAWDDGSPMSYEACWGSNGARDFIRSVARDALSALPERGERVSPDGWVLVPRDITMAMIKAGEEEYADPSPVSGPDGEDADWVSPIQAAWYAVIAAAPSAPEVPVKGEESPFAPMGGEQVSEGAQQ